LIKKNKGEMGRSLAEEVGVVVGLLLCAACVYTAPCNQTVDFGAQYTQCRADATHDLLWYVLPGHDCTGGDPLPANIFNLPCNIFCSDGSYLPLGSLNCSVCPPGTFIIGGGIIADQWNSWPTNVGQFSSYCQDSNTLAIVTPCQGWQLQGTQIRSGHVNDTVTSVLQLTTQFLYDGYVEFSYRVNAEYYFDGLEFYVDGWLEMPLTSFTPGFYTFSTGITAGFHQLDWWYVKDFSFSSGEDAAFINEIIFSGLAGTASSCTPCPEGQYASENGSAVCALCPSDSYAGSVGTAVCTNCTIGTFAYTGSTQCHPSPPCTDNDWTYLNSSCLNGKYTAVAQFLQPTICDTSSFTLPPTLTDHTCGQCAIGQAQDVNGNCISCPNGFYSEGYGSGCTVCPAGSYAAKTLTLDEWDFWPSYIGTYCLGQCGTSGWRLRSNFIDSGSGHGGQVGVTFEISLTYETPGTLSFNYEFLCDPSHECLLTFVDRYSSVSDTVYGFGWPGLTPYQYYDTVPSGVHEFVFTFVTYNYLNETQPHNDSVRIYELQFGGASIGGGTSCQPCPIGYYTSTPSGFCSECSIAHTNNSANTGCIACSGNTFNQGPGQDCYSCGINTASVNHTDCIDSCIFTLNGQNYDLTLITSHGLGIYEDDQDHTFYVNPCGRTGFPPICETDEGVPLSTHVCQENQPPAAYSLDAGWLPAYYPLPPFSAFLGFLAEYSFGQEGCGPITNGPNYPRKTFISFECDPTAGVGFLTGPVLSDDVENPPCNYNLIWRSLCACPLCTSSNYNFYYTPCVSGTRQKVYYWQTPLYCHDGTPLPATEVTSCIDDNTYYCGAGTILGADGQSCVTCPLGQYSPGDTTFLYGDFPIGSSTGLPFGYTTTCDSTPCTAFTSDDGFSIHSGTGSSSLTGQHTFVVAGSISFTYLLYAHQWFSFSIDGQVYTYAQDQTTATSVTYPVSAGLHTFVWAYSKGLRGDPTAGAFQGVTLSRIAAKGTTYHTTACLPCPPGTFLDESSNTTLGCDTCLLDTFSPGDASSCADCPDNGYSFPGASTCLLLPYCTPSDYVPWYTPCQDGQRFYTSELLEPPTCAPTGSSEDWIEDPVPCAPCPAGTFLVNDTCLGCPLGQYFNSTTSRCAASVAGAIVTRIASYFTDNSTYTLPSAFSTTCSGNCGSPGWRAVGTYVDSGNQGAQAVDSTLYFNSTLGVDGFLNFSYVLSVTQTDSGLQFFINGNLYPLPYPNSDKKRDALDGGATAVQIPLTAGTYQFAWNYHQEQGTAGLVRLSNIVSQGDISGIQTLDTLTPCAPGSFASSAQASTCSLCAPGSYAQNPGSTSCVSCPVNTYAAAPGQTGCAPCSVGTYTSTNGSSTCITSCVFTPFNTTSESFNLTTLGTATAYDSSRYIYTISVCQQLSGACSGSYACYQSLDGSFTSIGSTLQIVPQNASSLAPFSILLENGPASAQCPNGTSTEIQFLCDPSAGNGVPTFVTSVDCVYSFNWLTSSGCPVCLDSDYLTVTGVCSGGSRSISKTRQSFCNGPAAIDVPSEGCSSAEFPTGAVVAVVIVFVVIVAIAGFIFWRNRRLTAQYSQLRARSGSVGSDGSEAGLNPL